jgi:ubiquinone/menaquinone biosynthesis C-methylase UbiE
MDALNIFDGASVADLGAGGGWFSVRLARRVGPHGVVYAEDVQPQMLELIRRRAERDNLRNIRTVLGTASDPNLPSGIDAALIVDAYREMACSAAQACDTPAALLDAVHRALKPKGRLGVVDFNPGGGGPGPAAELRINPELVIKATLEAGFTLIRRESIAPYHYQYLLVFEKPEPDRSEKSAGASRPSKTKSPNAAPATRD